MGTRLERRAVIVTGAGSRPGEGIGNGKAAAIAYAREGASLILVDLNRKAAEETGQIIEKEGGRYRVFPADVTRAQDCSAMVEECLRAYGRVDILHNNVGIGQKTLGGPVEVDEPEWDMVINTNLKSMYLTCRAVLPQMVKQGCGAIINISSIAAVRIGYPHFVYNISKAGVNALTRSLGVMYAEKGIRVNAIMPGLIDTPMVEPLKIHHGGDLERMRKDRGKAVPMKRMGEAWDIAYASVFLASDEAKYITGQVIAVDGGLMCTGAAIAG